MDEIHQLVRSNATVSRGLNMEKKYPTPPNEKSSLYKEVTNNSSNQDGKERNDTSRPQ
jgi:hypothetical protein